MDNTFIHEKLLPRLTFHARLALTEQPGPGESFRRTMPAGSANPNREIAEIQEDSQGNSLR